MKYSEANTAFEESKFVQYWIINKGLETNYEYDEVRERATYSNIYGPFQKEEYLLKRKELGVPNSLHLEEE